MKAALVALLMAALALSGCTDGDSDTTDEPTDNVDRESFELEAGKGAIAGLLVDDRFRPIHLTDDPQTEFQTTGFVLLQETGEQVQTSENGEFTFVNLEPGTYTVRVTAAGHEATPQPIRVDEGVFNDASIIARRVSSDGSTIITQEYTIFSGCSLDLVAVSFANPWCLGDLSNDAGRFDFETNLTALAGEVHAMVTEARFNNVGYFDVTIRDVGSDDCPTTETWCVYADKTTQNSDYLRFLNFPGQIWVDPDTGDEAPYALNLNQTFQTAVFPHDPNTYGPATTVCDATVRPVTAAVAGADPTGTVDERGCVGVGTDLGVKAKFLQSVFLGEPDVDLESYCVLC